MAQRPLSPHLSIYRFAYTMATSILHRVSGLLLSAGLLLLAGWLVALASGPDSYAAVAACVGSWPGKVLLGMVLLAFCYHLCNGVRHLLWDLGIGLERKAARRSATFVIVVAVAGAAALAWLFMQHPGAT
jgi:succinate dehydrogenase / fumarate reductase cytochrome b subunit